MVQFHYASGYLSLHYPESRFYIRRIRLSKHSELLEPLEKAGYKIEPFGSEDTTMVVEVWM